MARSSRIARSARGRTWSWMSGDSPPEAQTDGSHRARRAGVDVSIAPARALPIGVEGVAYHAPPSAPLHVVDLARSRGARRHRFLRGQRQAIDSTSVACT